MNGPHDLGGVMGFGSINIEPDEPLFHAEWEKRVLGLTLCAGALGHWNLDISRHARENRHPVDYYSSSYYEIWLKGLERLLIRYGVLTADELSSGHALTADTTPHVMPGRVLTADRVAATISRGGSVERLATGEPLYEPGQTVRAANDHLVTHTRLPRYVRGRVGAIESVAGHHVFPDTNAAGEGEQPQWLYTVKFDGTELWGANAEPGLVVSVDAWEPYLESA